MRGCCPGRDWEESWLALHDAQGTARWLAVPVEILFNTLMIAGLVLLRARRVRPGQHFHLYLIAYGVFRFAHEFARDTPRLLGPVSGYQILSLGMTVLGQWAYVGRSRRTSSSHQGEPASR